jgi:DNA phosphorothioation-dependent restriction protein DptH
LGKTVNGDVPVYWEFGHRELANRHMLVFGTSGMGKTYAIQCLLSEFGRQGQNSLIIDYTDGFVDSRIENAVKTVLQPQQHYIRKEPLPINPFLKQISIEEGIEFPDSPNTIGKRVGAIFKSVYALGDQQFPVLVDAITEGVKKHGDSFTMAGLMLELEAFLGDPRYSKSRVQGVMTKLRPFVDERPFAGGTADDDWRTMFDDCERRCHVMQFLQVDRHTARALIEFVLWDLYAHARRFGNKDRPKVVVLDEIQNLDLGGDAPVAKFLTEGRKFGLCLIAATQTVKGVGGVNDACVSRLFQAEQKLFFKPTENEMREHAQLLHNAISRNTVQEWTSRLASLQRGECWSLGRCLNETTGALESQAKRIKVTSLEDRGFHA